MQRASVHDRFVPGGRSGGRARATGTLSIFAAGVLLIALRPFDGRDRIETAGAASVVERIEVFATALEADDGRRIVVRDAPITDGNILKHLPG